MSIVFCILVGVILVVICYIIVQAFCDNVRDRDFAGTVVSIIVITILVLGIGAAFHSTIKNHTQIVMEDYHRGKIEIVITTTQSGGNLIKQDTTYRYK